MNYKKLINGFVRSRVKDASQKSLDLFLGNESSAEEYDRCKEMAQIIDDWIEGGRQGITYKEVVDYLTQEGFVHYKDASPKREYWTTKNRLTTAGLMIMHTNKGNGELENEIVYICDFVSNIPALPKVLLGDSRRVQTVNRRKVKDARFNPTTDTQTLRKSFEKARMIMVDALYDYVEKHNGVIENDNVSLKNQAGELMIEFEHNGFPELAYNMEVDDLFNAYFLMNQDIAYDSLA